MFGLRCILPLLNAPAGCEPLLLQPATDCSLCHCCFASWKLKCWCDRTSVWGLNASLKCAPKVKSVICGSGSEGGLKIRGLKPASSGFLCLHRGQRVLPACPLPPPEVTQGECREGEDLPQGR